MRKWLFALATTVGLLASVPQAIASVAFVQAASGSTSGTSLGVAYSANVQAGDLLVGQFRTTGTTSVSDSVNGSWTEAVQTTSEGVVHSVWYRQNAAAGKTTVTVSGASSGSLRVVLGEYSGVATSGALDQTSCNQGTSTSVTTGATASVGSGDLLYVGVGLFEHPRTVTAGSSNGVAATLRTQFSGEFGTSAEEDVTSTASGAQNASFTLSESAPSGWAACAAAFHKLLPPEDTALPAVSGTAQQGSALSTSNGTWANGPTSYAYAWERCNSGGGECTTIPGASASAYTLQEEDVGHTIRSVVTASNAAGSGSPATSEATGVVQPAAEVAGPACNKYASTAASGTENGEKAHPYKTFKKLIEHTAAGEVGCLEEGQTFTESPGLGYTQAGSAGKPLTISSTNVNNPATLGSAMTISGNYVTVTHVKLHWEEPKPWRCWNSSGNPESGKVIKFVEGHPSHPCVSGTPTEEAKYLLYILGEHDALTYDDISSDKSSICVVPIYYKDVEPSSPDSANETLIEHDRIHDCGPPVYKESTSGNTPNEEKGWHMHGIYDEGKSTIVKNNYIYNNARNGYLDYVPDTNCACTHNVINHNGNGASVNGFEGGLGPVGTVLAWNVISNSTSLREAFDWGIDAEFYPAGAKEVNSAEDNILYDNLSGEIHKESGVLKEAGNKEATNPEFACGACEGELPNFEIKASYATEGYGPESPPTKY